MLKNPYRFLLYFIKKHLLAIILFVIFNIISNYINNITIPKYISSIIDSITDEINYNNIVLYIKIIISFTMVYIFFDILTRISYIPSFIKIKNDIIKYLFEYEEKHSIEFFKNSFSGSIGNKITSAADISEKLLFNLINIITVNFVLKLCILYSFYKMNFILALVNFLWIIAYTFIIFNLNKIFKIKVKDYEEQKNIF